MSLGADRIATVVEATRAPEPDRLAIARIGRERDAALARYRRDRDLQALEARPHRVAVRAGGGPRTPADALEPTPAAIAAGLVEASSRASAGYRRAERSGAGTFQLLVRIVNGNNPGYVIAPVQTA